MIAVIENDAENLAGMKDAITKLGYQLLIKNDPSDKLDVIHLFYSKG